MKKLLLLFLWILLLLSLCACGKKEAVPENSPETTIEVTESATETATITPDSTESWTLFETAFVPIARGEVGISQDEITAFLTDLGYEWSLGEGMLSVLDPEHPGSFMGGPLTTAHGISEVAQLSYHYVIEEGNDITERVQRGVLVNLMEQPPRYYIALDWLDEGTEVFTVAEMTDYLTNPKE